MKVHPPEHPIYNWHHRHQGHRFEEDMLMETLVAAKAEAGK
jgi:hypothetical protein